MDNAFPLLFSPIDLGPRRLKNRICCSAHADSLAEDGMPTERTVRYYELKARGGVGFMMCFGSASVHPTSPARDWNGVELFDDRVIPHLEKFSETMHRYGVPVVAQITHRGRRGRSIDTLERLYAPSAIREPNHRETPHAIGPRTMDEFVRAFADAARRLKQGGFDGCEVMASHCHLIDQFWTPNANRRTTTTAVTSPTGCASASGAHRRPRGGRPRLHRRHPHDRRRLRGRRAGQRAVPGDRRPARRAGLLDYFNIIGGTAETYPGEAAAVPDMSFPLGVYAPLSARIRQVVNVPVIATGRINDPAVAERVLREGQADLCIMNRALIADPDFPNKAREGRLDDIRQCMGYNQGCIDRIYTGRGVTCVQNAVIGREADWAELPRRATRRRWSSSAAGRPGWSAPASPACAGTPSCSSRRARSWAARP